VPALKFSNLTIAPKLGMVVGIALLGLCIAGLLAGYLMQQEMFNARVDEMHAIVDMARNMANGLQKEVEAGKLTKEQAIAEFGRRGNTLNYNNGSGYLFGSTMDGVTVLSPNPKEIGQNRADIIVNGRNIGREWLQNVASKGEYTMIYEYVRPGQEKAIRKLGYSVGLPFWNMYVGTGAYLDDLDEKMRPLIWLLGGAIFAIGLIAGCAAWLIGRSISRPLHLLGERMKALADG
jgi:methyl-accepting chemotaxis protein